MLKPGGAETGEGTADAVGVPSRPIFPLHPLADSGWRGPGLEGGIKEGWEGVRSRSWGEVKGVVQVERRWPRLLQGNVSSCCLFFFLFLFFIAFFSFFLDFKHKNHVLKKQPWCVECGNKGDQVLVFFSFCLFVFSCDKDLSAQSLNAVTVLCLLCFCCERETMTAVGNVDLLSVCERS